MKGTVSSKEVEGVKALWGQTSWASTCDIMSSLKEEAAQQLEGGRGRDPLWIGSPSTGTSFWKLQQRQKQNKIQERHGTMKEKIKWKTKVVKWDKQNVISTIFKHISPQGKQNLEKRLPAKRSQRTFTFCIHVCSLIISVTGKKSLGRTYASRFAWKPKTC